jgi:hypothetical protein
VFIRDEETGKMKFYPRVDVEEFERRLELLSPLVGMVYVVTEEGDAFRL